MQKQTAPLWVWSVIGVLLVGSYFYLANFYYHNGTLGLERQIRRFKVARQNYQAINPDRHQCRVLVWGSSYSRQAVLNHDEFATNVQAATQQDISVEKILLHQANPNAIAHLEDFYAIADSVKPGLLLIEDYSFLMNRLPRRFSQRLLLPFQQYTHDYKSRTKAKRTKKQGDRSSNFDKYDSQLLINEQSDTTRLKKVRYPYRIYSWLDHQLLSQQLLKLANHSKIVILNVPRPHLIEGWNHSPQKEKAIQELFDRYAAAGLELVYWRYPNPMPFSNYADMGHMNRQGREEYSRWLQGKIVEFYADSPCKN